MKLSIIATLLSISAMSFGQGRYAHQAKEAAELTNEQLKVNDIDVIHLDTIPITAAAHLQALPELVKESQALRQQQSALEQAIKQQQEAMEQAIRHNSEKVMLILSTYADPRKITGVTEDLKHVIIKK